MPTYSAEVLADSPTAYWRLGETTGATAFDETVSDADLTYTNVTLNQPGSLIGDSNPSARLVSASTSYVGTTAANAAYNVGDTLTLECRVRMNTLGATQCFFERGTNDFSMRMVSDNTVQVLKSHVSVIASSTIPLTAGRWYHIAWTKSGATNVIYIDGVNVTGAVTNASLVSNVTYGVVLGVDGTQPLVGFDTSYLDGFLDECAIYPTALSQARILAHYNASFGVPVLYWTRTKARRGRRFTTLAKT